MVLADHLVTHIHLLPYRFNISTYPTTKDALVAKSWSAKAKTRKHVKLVDLVSSMGKQGSSIVDRLFKVLPNTFLVASDPALRAEHD